MTTRRVLDGEPGRDEQRAEVGATVGQVRGRATVAGLVHARLQPGPLLRGVRGQEAREAVGLERPRADRSGARRSRRWRRAAAGSCQVVQGRRRPHQVGRAEVRPRGVEVGADGGDAVGHPGVPGLLPHAVQVVLGGVDGGHVRVGEHREQHERAGPGAAAQVDDAARAPVDRQTRHDRRGRLGEYLGVQFQDLRHPSRRAAVRVAVSVSVVRVGHVPHGRTVMRGSGSLLPLSAKNW